MSKFSNLPKRVLDNLTKIEKKIVTYPVEEKYKKLKDNFQNLKENRELIVVDKYGNRYYQYYSYHGLPTKRVVVHNMKGFNKWDDDPYMMAWLEKRRVNPPTQEELEKLYIQTEELQRRGLEWDRKERALIDEWKKKQQEALEKERKETKSIGDNESFQPGSWDRKKIEAQKENQNSLSSSDSLNSSLIRSDQLVEVKEEKRVVEGLSNIPGKYIMDFREEDEKWMQRRYEKLSRPYKEIADQIDWSKYSFEAMVERGHKENLERKTQIHQKQQELTNIGKRMLEKKDNYSRYSNFRERFKDVFSDPKFSVL